MRPDLIIGRYQHFKGGLYDVIDLARCSERDIWLVLYRPLYGDQDLWVRPYDEFFSNVKRDQYDGPRFFKTEPL